MSLVEDQQALLRMRCQASEGQGDPGGAGALAHNLDPRPSDRQPARPSSEHRAEEATGPASSDIIRLLEQYGEQSLTCNSHSWKGVNSNMTIGWCRNGGPG